MKSRLTVRNTLLRKSVRLFEIVYRDILKRAPNFTSTCKGMSLRVANSDQATCRRQGLFAFKVSLI